MDRVVDIAPSAVCTPIANSFHGCPVIIGSAVVPLSAGAQFVSPALALGNTSFLMESSLFRLAHSAC
jgi:hypothetical protein